MAWEKVPVSHVEAFTAALPRGTGVEQRKMFGCPAGFVDGKMFCGAHQRDMLVRLSEADRRAVIAEGGSSFEPMGRPMKEYVCLPSARVTDTPYLRQWFAAALAFVRTMPAKKAATRPAKKSARRGVAARGSTSSDHATRARKLTRR